MQDILLATDFSERADRALRRATLLARATGARLHLVHVIDDDQPTPMVAHERLDAQRLLDELALSLASHDGLTASARVLVADPAAGLAAAAADIAADPAATLLVIGPHRRSPLRDAFVGTTAERIIRSVSIPVLTVNAPPVGPWRHALLTTDLSPASATALDALAPHLAQFGARHTALHIFDAPGLGLAMSSALSMNTHDTYLESERLKANQQLSAFMAGLSLSGVTQTVRPLETTFPHQILATAHDLKADLLILATHARTGLQRLLLGSTAKALLQHAPTDVLTLPPVG